MNPYIAEAVAEMDKVPLSRLDYPGPGAMDPSSCRFLAAFIHALGAKRILEFGSGFSTLMMAREIEAEEDNYLLSIDDSPGYSALARDAFENSGCQARVEFRQAPLRPKLYGARLLLSYSLPKGLIEARGPFDLVLIDAHQQDHECESIFYDIFPAVAPGGYIILDDANREGLESGYARSWDRAYGDAIQPVLLEGIGNGLDVIEKLSDAAPAALPLGDSVLTSLKTVRNFTRLLLRGEK